MTLKAPLVLKTILGLLVGAWLGTMIALAVVAGYQSVLLGSLDVSAYNELLMITLLVMAFMVPTGLIAHAILYGLKCRAWLFYAAAALLAGGITGQLLVFEGNLGDRVKAFTIYGVWAAVCALITWLIRRPDKDAPAVCIVPAP